MSYALFAQRKQVLDSELNCAQLQQTQRSNEQFALATRSSNLQQMLSSTTTGQATQLKTYYEQLTQTTDEAGREQIQLQIDALQNQFDVELADINNEIYLTSQKENAIEMEVKRLDTVVSTLQQQLQACEQAEGQGIQNATPKFAGA